MNNVQNLKELPIITDLLQAIDARQNQLQDVCYGLIEKCHTIRDTSSQNTCGSNEIYPTTNGITKQYTIEERLSNQLKKISEIHEELSGLLIKLEQLF